MPDGILLYLHSKQKMPDMGRACILFCKCGAGLLSEEKSAQIEPVLGKFDADRFDVQDLCGVALTQKDVIENLRQRYDSVFIVACYPRAVENLFRQNAIEWKGFQVFNFRKLSPEEIDIELSKSLSQTTKSREPETIISGLTVPAWYPVIDQERCTHCGRCFKFCLFGVYSLGDKRLSVINPLNCKNNCPACGRTCPSSAIIFPRIAEDGPIAGAEPGTEPRPAVSPDSSLISALNQRTAMRRNLFRPGLVQQAEEERRRALEELKKRGKS